jgi:hypothetical protein
LANASLTNRRAVRRRNPASANPSKGAMARKSKTKSPRHCTR